MSSASAVIAPQRQPSPTASSLEIADSVQSLMMEELCILVDPHDKPIGTATKRECHVAIPSSSSSSLSLPLLHRAFSVFLFNEQGNLLLQQRASVKPTFASRWTNTCCSHPLAQVPATYISPSSSSSTSSSSSSSKDDRKSDVYDESEQREEDVAHGIKYAAIRKLQHELGLSGLSHSDFHFVSRIQYGALSDDQWGEHEIDYILFVQKDSVSLSPNPNEVDAVRWVSPSELHELLQQELLRQQTSASSPPLLTPWFHLIAEAFLFKWWEQLPTIITNDGIGAHEKTLIHQLSFDGAIRTVIAHDAAKQKKTNATNHSSHANGTTTSVPLSNSAPVVSSAAACSFL